MASLGGIILSVWEVLKFIVPTGVDPILFFTTFLITSVLIFAIVQVISFFRENRTLSLVVSLVIAYFTASSVFVTIMISKLFPNIGLAIMAILGVILVLVFLAPDKFKDGLGVSPLIAIIIFLVVLWLTWTFAAPALADAGILSTITGATGFGITNEDVVLVITILVIVGGIYFVFRGPKEAGKDSTWDWLKTVVRK